MRTSPRCLWAAGFLGVLLGVVQIVGFAQRASSSSPVIGVWRVSEVTQTGPNARSRTNLQPNVVIFTRGYYSLTAVESDAPRPELPAQGATDKQSADAFRPFVGRAGTYEIKGNEITFKVIAAKSPNAMRAGRFQVLTFRMEGDNTLWLVDKANEDGP